ncbi:ATP-binding protein [Pseudomonas sp. MH10out]|uniref:ATP-binding protein n=1 Tax=unclassified Pseudomonas TaxID=196821 RepID=UPI0034DCDA8E
MCVKIRAIAGLLKCWQQDRAVVGIRAANTPSRHRCQRRRCPPKLNTFAAKWPALAQQAAEKETSYADFLEQLLLTEKWSRLERRREALLNFRGFPLSKP